jgi:hypothetical protein
MENPTFFPLLENPKRVSGNEVWADLINSLACKFYLNWGDFVIVPCFSFVKKYNLCDTFDK